MTTDQKDELRIKFKGFSEELKNALQLAAARNKWDSKTWMLQVRMIAYSVESGTATESEIAEAYRVPVV